jgi:hypothetical protein
VLFLGEFKRSIRIGFPEINAWAEPIVVVVARQERFGTGKKVLSYHTVAAMIAEHETG